jgi:transposase
LRQCFAGKELVVILDNYSTHKSKKVARYVKRFPMIHLFYLPPYSPEYNPVERIWGWIKPKVYGFSAVGDIDELLKRFRKLVWHFNERSLVKPINLKLEAFKAIL